MNDNEWTYDMDLDFPKGPFCVYEQDENGEHSIAVPIMPHISGLHQAAVHSCRERHRKYRKAWQEFRRGCR